MASLLFQGGDAIHALGLLPETAERLCGEERQMPWRVHEGKMDVRREQVLRAHQYDRRAFLRVRDLKCVRCRSEEKYSENVTTAKQLPLVRRLLGNELQVRTVLIEGVLRHRDLTPEIRGKECVCFGDLERI